MPDPSKQGGNSQTLCINFSELGFETVERDGDKATVIRFQLPDEDIKMGDVLVVLDGSDIRFHGLISSVDGNGWGLSADRRGSTLPVAISQ